MVRGSDKTLFERDSVSQLVDMGRGRWALNTYGFIYIFELYILV